MDGGFFPLWTPDGKSIVFTETLLGGLIKSMLVDSGPAHTILDAHGSVAWLTFGPDGQLYYSMHDDEGRSSIFSVSIDHGTPRLLLQFDPLVHPSVRTVFTVGNGRIYFSSDDRQSDVWVMEVRPLR